MPFDPHIEGFALKLATFEIPTPAGPLRRIGAAVDGKLIDFRAAYAAHLGRSAAGCEEQKIAALLFAPDMVSFLELGELGRTAALDAIEAAAQVDEAFGVRAPFTRSMRSACWRRWLGLV